MANIFKGADVVSAMNEKTAAKIEALKEKGVTATLAIVRVGERADNIAYEKSATKRCETIGVAVKHVLLPEDITKSKLSGNIIDLNDDKSVHGILLLRPLPEHLSDAEIRAVLKPEKDVDGITDDSLAGVFTGSGNGFAPCTAQACMEILDYYNIDCTGKRVVIIGRSLVVGKPAAMMLMAKNATVTVCHTKTVDLPSVTRNAEILIVAAGQAESITNEYFSPGQIVVDVGINWDEEKGKLCGDVKFDDAEPVVAAITPVPGGVGTVTASVLISNVVEAAISQSMKQVYVQRDFNR